MKRLFIFSAILVVSMMLACSPSVPGPLKQNLSKPRPVTVNLSWVYMWPHMCQFLVEKGYITKSYPAGGEAYGEVYVCTTKARPYAHDNLSSLRIATFHVNRIVDAQKVVMQDTQGNTYEKYRLKIQIEVEPLLPELPTLTTTEDGFIEVLYDPFTQTVLQNSVEDFPAGIVKAYESTLK